VSVRLYVGNLPYSVDDEQLRTAFQQYGDLIDCKVIMDRDSDQSKGFGFVEMQEGAAEAAIQALDQSDFGGRRMVVSVAKEKPRKQGGGRERHGW
jgi:RNA recognition motif-containing protein